MQTLLTRFPEIAGVFSINDQMAIGADLAAKQLGRQVAITGIDGSPEAEEALKTDTIFVGIAGAVPFRCRRSVGEGRLRPLPGQGAGIDLI